MNIDDEPTILVLMERDGNEWRPLLWGPDRAWIREYVDEAKNPEFLFVWEVSCEEPAPTPITDRFCHDWLLERDFTEDEDDFMSSLPQYVEAHYGEEARQLYRERHHAVADQRSNGPVL